MRPLRITHNISQRDSQVDKYMSEISKNELLTSEDEATVKSIMPYGAFVEFMPGKQGLLHISEISNKRLETMEGVLKENEVIKVKLLGIDNKTGKFKLSRKALLEAAE